jgi:hypothetical protein
MVAHTMYMDFIDDLRPLADMCILARPVVGSLAQAEVA